MKSPSARALLLATATATLLLLASATTAAANSSGSRVQEQDSTDSTDGSDSVQLAAYFSGNWEMQGKFRYSPEAEWTPTKSRLEARGALDSPIVLREISAEQIGFGAFDVLTHNPEAGTVQYVYVNNQKPTALLYEGVCEQGCRVMKFEQLCGPHSGPYCGSRTTITIESDDRFVARDFLPRGEEEMMTREVIYTRSSD